MELPSTLSALMAGNPGVKSTILKEVGGGTGGLGSLLNLRRVNSVLRDAVDDPHPPEHSSPFSRVIASVGHAVQEENISEVLRQFSECPSPPSVTQLNLMCSYPPLQPTQDNNAAVVRFATHWENRLEWLQLETLRLPLTRNESRLFRCPSLRSVHLKTLAMKEPHRNHQHLPDLPAFLGSVSSFTLKNRPIPPALSLRLLALLSQNFNLRRLQIEVNTSMEARILTNLIFARNQDADFKLTLAVKVIPEDYDLTGGVELSRRILQSRSTITLVEVSGECFAWMTRRLEEGERRRLLNHFQSLKFWKRTRLALLEDFQNLRHTSGLIIREELLREPLPWSLRSLSFKMWRSSGFSFLFLPENLVHMNVQLGEVLIDYAYLAECVDAISVCCKSLRHLGIFAHFIGFRAKPRCLPRPITTLKSLEFHCHPTTPQLRKTIFLNVLRVHRLPELSSLRISSFVPDQQRAHNAIPLETQLVRRIVNGACAGTLRKFGLRDWFLSDAQRILTDLTYAPVMALATENSRNYHMTPDSVKTMDHFHFTEYCTSLEHTPPPPQEFKY